MSNAQLFRFSGFSLAAGAVIFIVHLVARSMITAGADPATMTQQPLWMPVNLLGVLGAILVLLGLPGLYVRMAGASGVSGLVGVILLALAWLFLALFLSLYSVLVAPWLANLSPSLATAPLSPSLLAAFIVAMLAEVVGAVLLALPFLRARLAPRWIGYVLPTAALLRVVGNLLAPSGPAVNLTLNLLSNSGPMLLLVALGYLGWRMWGERAQMRGVEQYG